MIIGIDNEYIAEDTPGGAVAPDSRPDVMETYCEVMQMGACRVDQDGTEVAIINKLVKPHLIHTIPPWLSDMTGITEERRNDEGVHFLQALEELVQLVGTERGWTFSGDNVVLAGNCAAHGVPYPFVQPLLRVKPRLADWGIGIQHYLLRGYSEMNSGHLHKVLGIELPSITGVGAHDACHDARSVAHSIHHIYHT